jgi:hypothetical protein
VRHLRERLRNKLFGREAEDCAKPFIEVQETAREVLMSVANGRVLKGAAEPLFTLA